MCWPDHRPMGPVFVHHHRKNVTQSLPRDRVLMLTLKRVFFLLSIVIAAVMSPAHADKFRDASVAIHAVDEIDLNRYQGRWYEIARFPFFFERDCYAVTADYHLLPNGNLSVLNQCAKGSVDGPHSSAEGEAWSVGPGRLKVSFVPIPLLKTWFSGDYWVLSIDEDYSIAVIGNPKGSTGWILARQTKISASESDAALATLRRFGYQTDALIWTEHLN